MKISETYGPQFDPVDGTIGDLQMVRRWLLVYGDVKCFYPRQGGYTFSTEDCARERIELLHRHNRPESLPSDLRPMEFWCYPGHFDPLQPVDYTLLC